MEIPTLFMRNPDDPRVVTSETTPECEWALDGSVPPVRLLDEDSWDTREFAPVSGIDCTTYDGVYTLMRRVASLGWKGIIWLHWDGRAAKLETKDLNL